MLSIVGLGQAGSNMAEEAQKLGILSGAINFSQKDLDSVYVKHKLRLLGSEGVGKRRNEAIELFQNQWNTAVSFVEDNFNHSQVIAFVFSTSGGSGSGIAPILIDLVSNQFPNKTIIAIAILPDKTESATSQINSLSTIEELSKLNIAIFPIDNEQTRLQYGDFGKNKLYESTNKRTINLFHQLFSYTQKTSKTGNFDEKDLITTLKTSGLASITEASVSSSLSNVSLSVKGVNKKVHDSWKEGLFLLSNTSMIKRAAYVFDGQDSLMEYVRSDSIFTQFETKPLEVFEGYYHESKGKIITVLMGLSWEQSRFSDIQGYSNISDDTQVSEQFTYSSRIPSYLKTKEINKTPILDILSKYNR